MVSVLFLYVLFDYQEQPQSCDKLVDSEEAWDADGSTSTPIPESSLSMMIIIVVKQFIKQFVKLPCISQRCFYEDSRILNH